MKKRMQKKAASVKKSGSRFDRHKEKLRKALMLDAPHPNRKLYWMAFLLPMFVLELCYISFRVFPFGRDSLLVLDLNAQYIYYYEAFRDAFWGEGSFIYSWSRALGGEMFGLNAYYMGSPLMLVYCLFPKKLITEALLTTALLRTGLASLMFAVYVKRSPNVHVKSDDRIRVVIFSTMYALMTYMVEQQMDPMWLDAVVLLPIVMLGVEKLIKERNFTLYTAILSLVFISNFYIGYMVAIFTFLYFFYAFFTMTELKKGWWKEFLVSGLLFGAFSLLCAAIAAVVLIPTYFSLSLGKLSFSTPSLTIQPKYMLFEALPKMLFGTYDTCRPEGLPVLFCGTVTLLMLPLYFTNRNIHVKKKFMMAGLLAILFMSMNISIVDLFWHGMQNPNWLNYRYSFIPCGLMLLMGYEAFANAEDGYSVGGVARAFLLWLGVIVITDMQKYEYVDVRLTVWAAMLCLLVFFGFLAYDASKNGKSSKNVLIALLVAVCAEMYANGLVTLYEVDADVVFSDRVGYRNFVDTAYPAAQWLKKYDTGFYRTEKTMTRCVNDNMALGLYGLSHSSSTLNEDALKYINKLGYSYGGHWTSYNRPIVAVDAILGIKYVLQDTDSNNGMKKIHQVTTKLTYPDLSDPENPVTEKTIYIYENEHVMPLVYPISASYTGYVKPQDKNPFVQQNAMLSALVGSEEIINFYEPVPQENISLEFDNVTTTKYGLGYTKYSPTDPDYWNCHLEFLVQGMEGKTLYAAFPSDYPRKVNVWINRGWYNTYLSSMEDQGIIPLGQYGAEETASLILTVISDELFLKDQLFYYFNDALFEEYFAPLRDAVENFTWKSTTHFTMDITAGVDQSLYTSIPYERGWVMTVDGEKVETFRTEDGLLGVVPLEGTHHYDLKFMPDYFIYACIITGTGLLLFAAAILLQRKVRKTPGGWKALLRAGTEKDPFDSDKTTSGKTRKGFAFPKSTP